jgi:hypothetical protein
MNDEVLLQPACLDAGLPLGILGCRGRRLADVGGGQDKRVEGDFADGDAAVMAGDSWDGRAKAVSRPVKPVTNPLSALFLSGRVAGTAAGRQGHGPPPGSAVRIGRSGLRFRIAAWRVSPSRWSCAPARTAAMGKTRWTETGALAHQRLIRFPREALGSASETGQAAKRGSLNRGMDRCGAHGRVRS